MLNAQINEIKALKRELESAEREKKRMIKILERQIERQVFFSFEVPSSLIDLDSVLSTSRVNLENPNNQ